MSDYLGKEIPKLGFGLMRVPMKGDEIDMEQAMEMVDLFMENGFTYFDTAYGYVGGRSEGLARAAVVERFPRESFQLATKFPLWEPKERADVQRIFDTQMERTGAGYFDFYMLHAVGAERLSSIDELGLWDFIKDLKAKGLAKHIGFSYHDNADVLDKILTDHPEVEFVQLQLNYIDWDSDDVQSGRCYEVCRKHDVAVIVMEPVKGGMLATIQGDAAEAFKALKPDASMASWAMRYCASLDGVITVLSGMSNMEQMVDNVKTISNFEPLTDREYEAVERVVRILKATETIPCTSCQYCTEKCPQNINIPAIFRIMNNAKRYGVNQNLQNEYNGNVSDKGKASDCIACGVCESRCPQHIAIIEELGAAAALFEG